MYRYFSISIKSAIFISINIYELIVLLISLIIVVHTELYITIYTLLNIVFSKHDFSYNCENWNVKLCFDIFAIITGNQEQDFSYVFRTHKV